MKFFALKINPIFFSPPLSRGKRKEPPTVFERDRELGSESIDERKDGRYEKRKERRKKERKSRLDA